MLAIVLGAVLLTAASLAQDTSPDQFDPTPLLGRWVGEGSAPLIGSAQISFDAELELVGGGEEGPIRFYFTGRTMLMDISDSAHISAAPDSDSLRCRLWDGFGREWYFEGEARGDSLLGRQPKHQTVYSLTTNWITADSMHIAVASSSPNKKPYTWATLRMKRVAPSEQ